MPTYNFSELANLCYVKGNTNSPANENRDICKQGRAKRRGKSAHSQVNYIYPWVYLQYFQHFCSNYVTKSSISEKTPPMQHYTKFYKHISDLLTWRMAFRWRRPPALLIQLIMYSFPKRQAGHFIWSILTPICYF